MNKAIPIETTNKLSKKSGRFAKKLVGGKNIGDRYKA